MSGRLGDVFYWTGCIIAGLAVLFGGAVSVALWMSDNSRDHDLAWFPMLFASVGALICWLIGHALQYVLSSK
jgi:hypothetical protein